MTEESTSISSRQVGRYLYRIFIQNAHLKVIALLLTLALYVWVGADEVSEVMPVPLKLSVPANQVLLEPRLEQVQIEVEGRASAVERFRNRNDRAVRIQLSRSNDGQKILLTHDAVDTPPGVKVVNIEPGVVQVELADKQRKEVPIRPRLAGTQRPSLEVGEVSTTPEKVVVQGPKEAIDQMEVVPTEPIDLSTRNSSFTTEVSLRPPSPNIRYELNGLVEVSVELRLEELERTLTGIAVRAVNTSYGTEVEPSAVALVVRGPRTSVQALSPADVYAIADMSAFDDRPPGNFERPIQARGLPDDIDVVRSRPERVVVTTRQQSGEPRPVGDAGTSDTGP